ncbi:MAG: TonB-dependent receptor domain-containing protein, partial [Pseudomonadota bacterium]
SRVEILTDGGSALYGADAVAGVVNVIMRNDFVGAEIYGDVQTMEASDGKYDTTLSGIYGWESADGRTNFVISGERFERDPVSVDKASFYNQYSEFTGTVSGGFGAVAIPSFGANLNPGYLATDIMQQNVAEGGDGSPVYRDPLCGSTQATSLDGTPFFEGTLREDRGERGGACREDTTQYNFISRESTRTSIAGSFNHTFSDRAEFYSFFNHSSNETVRADDGYNQSRGPTVFLAQPGAFTRNPQFGGNAIGQTMELGFFAPEIGLERPTADDITNAPVDIRNGGINVPLWTSVRAGVPRSPSSVNTSDIQSNTIQAGLRGDFYLADRAMNYDVGVSWSNSSMEQDYQTFNRQHAELAANGLGGPNCTPNGVPDFDFVGQPGPFGGAVPQGWDFYGDSLLQTFFPGFVFTTRESLSYALTSNNQGQGGCQFYNPFLTRLTDGNVANSEELMDWMNPTVKRADKRNSLAVIDAIVGGEMFEMAGGTAQFAAGLQYRERNASSIAPTLNQPGLPNAILDYDENGVPNEFHYVSNNFECSLCNFNFDYDRTTKATFLELSLPFLENVESQFALRWEDYGGQIGGQVSPKVAMSWRPMESILFRGSWSQSFRAPNIAIIQEGLESSSVTFRDPFANQAVRAGLLEPTPENGEAESTYTLGGPAPNVGNESADTFSAGFQWTPFDHLDGLRVQADVWRFEVEDRVLPEPPVTAQQPEIANFLAARENPDNYILNDSIESDAAIPYESCDPQALEAQYGRDSQERLECVVDPRAYLTPGIQRSLTSTTANLITLTLSAINAGMIESDGVDLKVDYNWDTNLGRFSIGADYTYVNSYKLINVPGLEFGLLDTGVTDAAGTTGDGNLVRSLPDHKGNITFNWQNGAHGFTAITRYIGSYRDLAYEQSLTNANDLVRSLLSETVDSHQTWDIQYRYNHQWGNSSLGSTQFTLGVLDLFDEPVPYRETGGLGYDGVVHDGRGRRIYGRALWRF